PSITLPTRVSDDGRLALFMDNNGYSVREFATWKLIAETTGLDWPLDFTPDGRSVLGRDSAGYLQRWDLATGKPRYPHPEVLAHSEPVTWLAYSPDGQSLY